MWRTEEVISIWRGRCARVDILPPTILLRRRGLFAQSVFATMPSPAALCEQLHPKQLRGSNHWTPPAIKELFDLRNFLMYLLARIQRTVYFWSNTSCL